MQKIIKNGFLFVPMIMVLFFTGCPTKGGGNNNDSKYRVFPNAPAPGTVTYEWFEANAPVSYWNNLGHNHKYPDPFRFMDGTKVQNAADWEKRRTEISLMLQYYMHGRMPSIADDVLEIEWEDDDNTCTIDLKHIASGRTAQFEVKHNPPGGATGDSILLFGVGMAPAARNGWGTAAFQTTWGGSESNRGGTCATLYGIKPNDDDTPSVNMEYAWAMSVILTVIKEGGLNGYYDPDKVGIYGFSRWGKAAMIIGAFAEGREGNQIGQTFIGSAGSGGPALDRWINQMGYKNLNKDPLPVNGEGVKDKAELIEGLTWYLIDAPDKNNAQAKAYGAGDMKHAAMIAARGWTASTPGIPSGSLIYDEYTGKAGAYTRNPGPPNSWGRLQTLSQARSETSGWFSARFRNFTDLHSGARLDGGSGGILCTMPFDAHFITALIAPRIVLYEEGLNTTRNNPEGQWANWLICDEIYQMYAEAQSNPSIIWRNAIMFYDIEHQHFDFQNVDEYELTTDIYAGTTPEGKFRTPPFPADDPRYRWDFNRMDFGRPGHPSIAERVKKMRESTVKVKAVDTRGLLDTPDNL